VPPDVNRSDYRFTAQSDDTIIYGLGAIKGVGQAAIEGLLEERAAAGSYQDLFDFCQRVDLRKLNRRVIDALIRAGALDSMGETRASHQVNIDRAPDHALCPRTGEHHQRQTRRYRGPRRQPADGGRETRTAR
jgi:DNA polymerase-3 subunit alpha